RKMNLWIAKPKNACCGKAWKSFCQRPRLRRTRSICHTRLWPRCWSWKHGTTIHRTLMKQMWSILPRSQVHARIPEWSLFLTRSEEVCADPCEFELSEDLQRFGRTVEAVAHPRFRLDVLGMLWIRFNLFSQIFDHDAQIVDLIAIIWPPHGLK